MKDKTTHNEITVGSYVVYGHALGRCAGLKFGKIVKIDKYDDSERFWVVGVDDDWKFNQPSLTKVGRLSYPERIVVIPFEMLPEYAQELLKDAKTK